MSAEVRASPTAKRFSGRVVAISLASVLALGVTTAVTLWHLGKDPHGPVIAVAGIDADNAAVLRRGYEERGYVHLLSTNREGDVRWSGALFGLQEPEVVAVGGGRVYVRVTEARGNPSLHAFDAATGQHAWSLDSARQGNPIAPPVPPLHARGDVVWEIADRDPMIVSVVSHDGELIERLEFLPSSSPDAFLIDAGLALSTNGGWVVIDADGSQSALAQAPSPPDRSARPGELCPPSHVDGVTWSCLRHGRICSRLMLVLGQESTAGIQFPTRIVRKRPRSDAITRYRPQMRASGLDRSWDRRSYRPSPRTFPRRSRGFLMESDRGALKIFRSLTRCRVTQDRE